MIHTLNIASSTEPEPEKPRIPLDEV